MDYSSKPFENTSYYKHPRKFHNEFPRAKSYATTEAIAETFPHLKDVNSTSFDLQTIKNAYCFVLRSNNDDDIHKAIKYELWISTPANNEYLSRIYSEATAKGQDVLLFYSVVKSGQFVGVAKMASNIQDKNFPYWWQSHKWRGQFSLKWLFIKDISYKYFEKIYNVNNLPVIRSKDCTEIDWSTNGSLMLQIFKDAPIKPNIFQEFEYMDEREDWLISQRNMNKYYKTPNYMSNGYYGGYAGGYMYGGGYNMPYEKEFEEEDEKKIPVHGN